MVFVAVFLAVYLALGVIAWRRPLQTRLALREVVRRPWQSALLVAGLTVGTSMILMSLIMGDSMNTSLSKATFDSWGRVDILVGANGQFFPRDVAQTLSNSQQLIANVRGVQAGVELVGVAADLDRRLDNPTVRLIGFDPTAQAPFGWFTLSDGRRTDGRDLAPGQVMISDSLARSLLAQKGDSLTIAAAGFAPATFNVFGIATKDGPGDYGAQPAVFATLDAMRLLTGTSEINVVRVSALGNGRDELNNSLRLAGLVAAALQSIPGPVELQARSAKADDVIEIEKLAAANEPVNMTMSFIIILAGVALVVNLVIALAEERRPNLAVLRALGLSRSGLVVTGLIEGSMYAFAAAIIGSLPGIAAGWLLVSNAGRWVPEIHEKDATILFVVSAQAVAIAVTSGALFTLLTLFVATLRGTRFSIAAAVRSLPDAPKQRKPRSIVRLLVAAAGVAGLIAAVFGETGVRLVGGLAVIGAAGYLAARVPNRIRATLFSGAAVCWLFAIYATMSFAVLAENLWITVLMISAAVVGLSVVVAANIRLVEQIVPRTLVAHLTRRMPRLILATTALSLVLALLTFIGVFLATTQPDYRRDSGGYDVAVTSTTHPDFSLSAALARQVERTLAISTSTYFGRVRSSLSDRGPGPLDWHQQLLPLYQLTDEQLASSGLPIASRDRRFASDAAAWAALRDHTDYVVSGTYPPYTTIDLVGNDGPVRLTVIATFKPGFLEGVMGSTQALTSLPSGPAGTTMLVRLKPGVEPAAFALAVRQSTFPAGVEAVTTEDMLNQGSAIIRNFAGELELILLAGLGVGVMSLGVLALRAVVERRRTIGLLRAVGYQPGQLLAAVMGESLLTATVGILIGVTVGLFTGSVITSGYYPGGKIAFQLDYLSVAVAIVLVTAAAVTAVPAFAVARTAPAEALRFMD